MFRSERLNNQETTTIASYNQAKQVVDTMCQFYKHTPCASILLGIN